MSGQSIPTAVLTCDERGCDACYVARGSIMHVRRAAVSEGWVHAIRQLGRGVSPTYDFCPQHAAVSGEYTAVVP